MYACDRQVKSGNPDGWRVRLALPELCAAQPARARLRNPGLACYSRLLRPRVHPAGSPVTVLVLLPQIGFRSAPSAANNTNSVCKQPTSPRLIFAFGITSSFGHTVILLDQAKGMKQPSGC